MNAHQHVNVIDTRTGQTLASCVIRNWPNPGRAKFAAFTLGLLPEEPRRVYVASIHTWVGRGDVATVADCASEEC